MKIEFIAWMVLLTVFLVLPYSDSAVLLISLSFYKLINYGIFIHLFSLFTDPTLCSKVLKKEPVPISKSNVSNNENSNIFGWESFSFSSETELTGAFATDI